MGAGIGAGIITGLAPGIHINIVVTLVLASTATLLTYTSPFILCIFIVALSITHQFLEFIPSIFLGAPDASTVLSVLPGHRYLLRGYGLMALKLSTLGCFFGLIMGSILMYPLIKILPTIYHFIQASMLLFLLLIVTGMVLHNNQKLWAILIFLLSGTAGMITFSIPNIKEPLFPLLTGLFGAATLLVSLQDKNQMPEQQEYEGIHLERAVFWKALLSGQIAACFIALFPGVSPTIATLCGMQFTRKKMGDHGYMLLQGCVNAAGFLLSIAALYSINKARNGSVVGIQQLIEVIQPKELLLFVLVALITAALVVPVTIGIGRIFCRMVNKINYKKLSIGILCFITVLVVIISGWIGLLVFITATAIGTLPAYVNVTRTMAMGCLLLPTIVYYLW
jgi:putative membrane protein